MTQLFLTGGLGSLDVAVAVLGGRRDLKPAVSQSGKPGLLLAMPQSGDQARLAFYSEVLGTAPGPETSQDGGGLLAYGPPPYGPQESAAYFAQEVMARFGSIAASDVARWLGRLSDRAWSRHLAEGAAPRGIRQGSGQVVVDQEQRPHDGFFTLQTHRIRPLRFDGQRSEALQRETFHGTDAALVLPYDPVTDRVLLVEQFRMGPFIRGDGLPWTLEPVAGLVDPGESPSSAAKRECLEEAGLELIKLIPVQSFYASPGGASDYFHCFVGLCDLADYTPGIGGKADEHEDILSHVLSFEETKQLLNSGEADVGPLILLLLWLQLHREELRRGV